MNGVGLQEPAIEKKPADVHGPNPSALAVRERSVTLFFLLAIIIAGAVAYLTLGRAEDPTFTIKVFTVAAAWPGATAQEMQDLVAEPLEKRMQELKYYYQRRYVHEARACISHRRASRLHTSRPGCRRVLSRQKKDSGRDIEAAKRSFDAGAERRVHRC